MEAKKVFWARNAFHSLSICSRTVEPKSEPNLDVWFFQMPWFRGLKLIPKHPSHLVINHWFFGSNAHGFNSWQEIRLPFFLPNPFLLRVHRWNDIIQSLVRAAYLHIWKYEKAHKTIRPENMRFPDGGRKRIFSWHWRTQIRESLHEGSWRMKNF